LKALAMHQKDPAQVPLGFLTIGSFNDEYRYRISYANGNTVVYDFIFNDSAVGNETSQFTYSFAIKYPWEEEGMESQVSIEPIPPITINESDGIMSYQARGSGEALRWSEDSELIYIDPITGRIIFDAEDIPYGMNNILIKAIDVSGNIGFAYLTINSNKSIPVPMIGPIPKQYAEIGEQFYYKVDAQDPSGTFLTFLDDTSLFNINVVSGEIRFTPATKGNYTIKISAINEKGYSHEYMRLEVR